TYLLTVAAPIGRQGGDMTAMKLNLLSVAGLMVMATFMPAFAKSAQEQQDEKMGEIPVCTKKLGAVAAVEPETNGGQQRGWGSSRRRTGGSRREWARPRR